MAHKIGEPWQCEPDMVTFTHVWIVLATQGECDAEGSREYIRVAGRWLRQGKPTPIAPFIRREANAPPPAA